MNERKTVKIFNTLTKKIEAINPIAPPQIGVYCCGPTVYNYQHIGNLRTYIFEDTLIRILRYAGYKVLHVMNITDVGHLVSDADEGEDKMLVASKREGKTSKEIADFYTKVFFEHCSWLNINKPDIVCKASEHIPQMISLIQQLQQNGFAYEANGNVYFDVAKFDSYGQLARLNQDALKAGARIEVDKHKRGNFDFALWFTKSKFENQEMQWDSPWGKGYPGWHIECSAMSMNYLGETLDIHCGGIDHIPVHHTNEIAQSQGATGKTFANYWVHGGFLVLGKDKMSKSSGEFLTLDLVKQKEFDPIAYRLFCYSGSYRQELAWSWNALEAAANTLRKLKNTVFQLRSQANDKVALSDKALDAIKDFDNEVFTDMNMPNALAVLHQSLSNKEITAGEKLELLSRFDSVLGLGVDLWKEDGQDIPSELIELLEKREAARKAKDFKQADILRNEITKLGYLIEDRAEGPRIRRV